MNNPNRETLQKILSIAQRSKSLVESRRAQSQCFISSHPQLDEHTIPLRLPYPTDIFSDILTKSLPAQVAEALSKKVHAWIVNVQILHSNNFKHLCRKLQPANPLLANQLALTYERSYQDQYINWLRSMLSQYLCRIRDETESDKRRRIFNVEYTPILERYFQLNAYPSAIERRSLAERSGMTGRQIEVWFQNHRNRSKKDGLSLPRRVAGQASVCLDALERDVLGSPTSDTMDEDASDDDQSLYDESLSQKHPFSSNSPDHAFPTKYPPDCASDPFPMASGTRFPAPEWPRKPLSGMPCYTLVDIDELAASFSAKLSFRDNTPRSAKQGPVQLPDRKPWFCATTTIPSAAPHPSFVKPQLNYRYSSAQSTCRFSPFPLSVTSPNRSSCKPRLPRRLPDWSKLSLSQSKLPSRTASLESISSCDSSSSNPSLDELATPPLTPVRAPVLIFDDFFDDSLAFDFPNLSPSIMPFGLDASNKSLGGFPPMFPPFQYATSS